ncbi:MAG: hypothetical protein ABI550_02325, partial [Ignavibacteriaceae bacterium]
MIKYQPEENFYKKKENLYLKVREKEGRIYDIETLKKLPDVHKNHRHSKEWSLRKKSAENLTKYFLQFSEEKILDLGCGNGWLSNYLVEKTSHKLFAVD